MRPVWTCLGPDLLLAACAALRTRPPLQKVLAPPPAAASGSPRRTQRTGRWLSRSGCTSGDESECKCLPRSRPSVRERDTLISSGSGSHEPAPARTLAERRVLVASRGAQLATAVRRGAPPAGAHPHAVHASHCRRELCREWVVVVNRRNCTGQRTAGHGRTVVGAALLGDYGPLR